VALAGQRGGRHVGDVLRVDERDRAVAAGCDEASSGRNTPSVKFCANHVGPHVGPRKPGRLERELGWRERAPVGGVGAAHGQEHRAPDARGLRPLEEGRDERRMVEPQRRRDDVDAVDAGERGVVRRGVVPVEDDRGDAGRGGTGGAGGGADRVAGVDEGGDDAAAGLAGGAEDEML
jgi:hypothetical protein